MSVCDSKETEAHTARRACRIVTDINNPPYFVSSQSVDKYIAYVVVGGWGYCYNGVNIHTFSLFCIEWIYASKCQFKGCFSVAINYHTHTSINYHFKVLAWTVNMSTGVIKNWILVCFQRFYSDKITALGYAFIVFPKKITVFWCMFIIFTSITGQFKVWLQ